MLKIFHSIGKQGLHFSFFEIVFSYLPNSLAIHLLDNRHFDFLQITRFNILNIQYCDWIADIYFE